MKKVDLPEQKLASQSINNMIATGKFPHAMLLTGKTGFGSLHLAIQLAKAILTFKKEVNASDQLEKKIDHFMHPDLHTFYPINTTKTIKSKPTKNDFVSSWREFIKNSLYQDHSDWFKHIGLENKQGIINVQQAKDVVDSLKLKPYEADAKVALIWGANYMNQEAANKLLKIIEEPPANSYLILMSENKDQLLSTILSRCQEISLLPLNHQFIADYLSKHYNLNKIKAVHVADQADRSLSKAIRLAKQTDQQSDFEQKFIQWVRYAFLVSKKKAAMQNLIEWSTQLASEKKDYQRNFLLFCLQFFRQAYLNNQQLEDLVFYQPEDEKFSFDKFSNFIHETNYPLIIESLENSIYELDRNVNTKALLADISLQLAKLLHMKNK